VHLLYITNKGSQQMQLSIYLYCIRSHPTCFGPPPGPSSGVAWAASSCRHLAHAVLLYIRVSADSTTRPPSADTRICSICLVVCFLLPKAPLFKGPTLCFTTFILFRLGPHPTPTLLAQHSLWSSTTYIKLICTHTFCPTCLLLDCLTLQ
jgi:hypothetical protein